MDATCFFLGLVLAFVGFIVLGAPREGRCPRLGMNLALVLPGRRRCLHVHHWMLAAVLKFVVVSVVCLSGGRLTASLSGVLGACVGAMLSGFLYTDALDIIQPCQTAQPC